MTAGKLGGCTNRGIFHSFEKKSYKQLSAKWPCRSAMWIFQPEFWGEFFDVNFGRWISRGWILRGLLLLENTGQKNPTPEFGPQIRGSKIRIPEFDPEFGFTRCKIPSAETCPWAIVSRTLCGMFLVGPIHRPRTSQESPPSKKGEFQKGNRTHQDGRVHIKKPRLFGHF